MDSSFEMFNRNSYFPIYSYPLSEVSSFRSNNNSYPITTNDYSDNIYTNPSITPVVDQSNMNNLTSLIISRSDHCLVCSDRASGIHFGVSTCEACKAFFRRTSLSIYSIPSPCSPNRCEINIKNRNNCPSCRFDKCKRLGMDRDNVIYGKPSKQNIYHQEHFLEQLTNLSNELIKLFQNIHSSIVLFDNKQQINRFGHILLQLFYQQTSLIHINSSDIIEKIFILIYKNNHQVDYCFIENMNLRTILSCWLFVYYYETFLFKQQISQDKLTILIKLLDMELNKTNTYDLQDQTKQKAFRIDFMNTFTKFSTLLQEIYLEN
ncbi:unnamed protein product [Adineta steineri]|uniref:Nuclear receptor domain-containing protein n=1 Tax=Adineta steineri TaxID=433720 RepID=A0A815EWF5_9BILA|nr:unnamed protein product [Adineta steineri]